MTFRERLREEIEYKGITIKELSTMLGISNSTFLSYIDARGSLPNVETAVKIAQALDVSVEYLVTGKDFQQSQKQKEIQVILKDLQKLDEPTLNILKPMIHVLAQA